MSGSARYARMKLEKQGQADSESGSSAESDGETDWDDLVAELSRQPPPADGGADRIVFSSRTFYAVDVLYVTVLRTGPCDCRCIVKMTVTDDSLKATDFIGGLERVLMFESAGTGAQEQVLKIRIKDDNIWQGVRHCSVNLEVVQSVRATTIAEQGGEAQITVSDSDCYPEDISPPTICAWIQNQRKNRGIKLYKSLVCLAYMGIHSVIEAYILKVFVDTAVKDDADFESGDGETPEEKRQTRFYYCALAYMISFAIYYCANMTFKENRGFGGTTKWLRDKLFSKFMSLGHESMTTLSDGSFMTTAIYQSEELMVYGWKQVLSLWQASITIIANIIFQLYLLVNKVEPVIKAVLFCLSVPAVIALVMFVSYQIRDKKMQRLIVDRQNSEDSWLTFAQELVQARRMVFQYGQTEPALKNFRNNYSAFWLANRTASTYQLCTGFIPQWFFALGVIIVYAFAPSLIRNFAFGAGDFAALIKSWMKLDKACNKIYFTLLNITRARAALKKISALLNRPDRVAERVDYEENVAGSVALPARGMMGLEDQIQFEGVDFHYLEPAYRWTERGAKNFKQYGLQRQPEGGSWINPSQLDKLIGEGFGMDEMVGLEEKGHVTNHSERVQVLSQAAMTIPCHMGGVWLLVGTEGKRTVLRLLGSSVYPQTGRIIVPAFRKTVYVDREVHILENSVLRNLSFGRPGGVEFDNAADRENTQKGLSRDEAEKDRELRLLCEWTARVLGVSERLCKTLDKQLGGDVATLRTQDVWGLTIARAFLSEADLLLVDHVADGLGREYLATLTKQMSRYAAGGLREVLEGSGIVPQSVLPPAPTTKPMIIWSPVTAYPEAHGIAAGVIEVTNKRLRVR